MTTLDGALGGAVAAGLAAAASVGAVKLTLELLRRSYQLLADLPDQPFQGALATALVSLSRWTSSIRYAGDSRFVPFDVI